MTNYPHTISDGSGEELTFAGRYEDSRGAVLQINSITAPGSGPPLHAHRQQFEQMTVQAGRVGFVDAAGDITYAEAGETRTFEPGEVHRFFNAGSEPLKMSGEVWPAGNFEWFITQMFESMRSTGKGRPRPFDGAYLSHKYRTEFETRAVPAPVRKIVFPAIVSIGSALGLDRRFADAPAPLVAS